MIFRCIVVASFVVATAAACAHRPAVLLDRERAELLQRQDTFLAALSARDLEAAMGHFATDAVLHVPNMPPVEGESAIRQFYGNVFRFLSASTPSVESTRLSASADVAYSVGSVRNVFAGAQGAVEYSGKFSLVWEKRAGEWSIVLYGISNNHPDAGR